MSTVGHNTEGCWALRKEIEDLIQRGFLGRFVRQGRGEGQRHDRPERRDALRGHSPDQDTQNLAGVINTIAGGPTGGTAIQLGRTSDLPPREMTP